MQSSNRSIFVKSCKYGGLIGLLWGALWIGILLVFNLHQIFYIVNQPLLIIYEKIIGLLLSPDAVEAGLLLLEICFIVTGMFIGGVIGCIKIIWKSFR